jgi:Mg2+ and Co2+ transporter CorA
MLGQVLDLLFQQRQETSEYHAKVTEYQAKMLEQQEIIASQTKRDNTIVKIIAVLTALFLPATVTAVSCVTYAT